jgi:hypothetical protein
VLAEAFHQFKNFSKTFVVGDVVADEIATAHSLSRREE